MKGHIMNTNKLNLIPLSLAGLTILAGTILVSSIVSADDSVVDEINITVPLSCTLSGTGMDAHNAEINNGTYNSAIGETTLKAFCNDNEGFAIYAIGYTDNEEGKNVLTNSTLGSTYDITTGTAITGNDSKWAMKLTKLTSSTPTYPIIIAGSTEDSLKEQGDPDYSAFQQVPDDYEKVAYRTSATDTGTNAEGATLTTTYQAYISKTQPAGTYTGQVKYALVHPHDATAPTKPITIESAMGAAGKTKLNGYYKMQDLDNAICSTVSVIEGDGMAELIDVRDNHVYKVTKLKDGNCWLLDNLALNPTDPTTAANMSSNNTNASDRAIYNYLNGGNPDNVYGWSSAAVLDWSSSDGFYSIYEPRIITANTNTLTTSYGPASTNGQAKVGIYYNYCAATVGTFCGSGVDIPNTAIDAPEDICPANWRLPMGGVSDSEFLKLAEVYNFSQDTTNTTSLQYNLSTPLSGVQGFAIGYEGYWWTSTYNPRYGNNLFLALTNDYVINYGTGANDDFMGCEGYTVRCIVDNR